MHTIKETNHHGTAYTCVICNRSVRSAPVSMMCSLYDPPPLGKLAHAASKTVDAISTH